MSPRHEWVFFETKVKAFCRLRVWGGVWATKNDGKKVTPVPRECCGAFWATKNDGKKVTPVPRECCEAFCRTPILAKIRFLAFGQAEFCPRGIAVAARADI